MSYSNPMKNDIMNKQAMEEWERRFEEEFMEYAEENENTLLDSDTDSERIKDFIRELLTRATAEAERKERERILGLMDEILGYEEKKYQCLKMRALREKIVRENLN